MNAATTTPTPVAPPKDPWLARTDEALALAREAQVAGDIVGSIAAAVLAGQCVQIAKHLGRADDLRAESAAHDALRQRAREDRR